MTATTWAVMVRGMIESIHLTPETANARAAALRRTVQRASDVTVKPRPAVHPGWRREAVSS